jgi:hypothetical protein
MGLITFLDACRFVIIDYFGAEWVPVLYGVKSGLFGKGRHSLDELRYFSRHRSLSESAG